MSFQIPDKNLIIETSIGEEDVVFYDVREEPFNVYGLYNYKNEEQFKRLPDEIGLNVNPGVSTLYLNTAGGRVRFCTDSQYVAIKAEMPSMRQMTHMAFVGSAGFDLYLDSPEAGISRFFGSFRPSIHAKEGFEAKVKFATRKKRWITINFPTYSPVKNLFIGLQKDASVGSGARYRSELPLLYYGSSITQGGCCSRPGNAYEAIISRDLDLDFINLGFSGNGKAEQLIADYMAKLPMLAFICDYDHNAPNTEYLRNTHCNLYRTIREKNPDLPYIMVSRPDDLSRGYELRLNNRDVVIDTFRYARQQGDKNVYYLDGSEIFRGYHEDQCTVDGVHPNDMGFALMAEAIGCAIRQALLEPYI